MRYFRDPAGHVYREDFRPSVNNLHPVAVIAPEDREQVERLWQTWRDLAPDHRLAQDNLQAALREFANPTPLKPEEPMGLGAVVEDADGKKWFRMALENQTWPGEVWQEQYDNADRWSQWQDIAVARILSEGVTA